jgi:hypothetical protein
MGSGSLSRRLGGHRPREIVPRLVAFLRAPYIDADLAAGVRPSASPAHRLRANHLLRRRVRRRIAEALNRAVEDARHPTPQRTPRAPIRRRAVRGCEREIRALGTAVAMADHPRVQGIAIASQLAFDGGGPLFSRPDAPDEVEPLANTIQSARSALKVSAEFD